MEVRSRPPRIFEDEDKLVAFDFTKSIGHEIIKKFGLTKMNHE